MPFSSFLTSNECALVDIPCLEPQVREGTSWPVDHWEEDFLSIHEDKPESTSNKPHLDKILTAVRREVSKQVSCVPWKCMEVASIILREHKQSVKNYIQLTVPLHDPHFIMNAMDRLFDRDTYVLEMPDYTQCSYNFRLGREIEWMNIDVLVEIMEEFVLGAHGELTGYKKTMSDRPQGMNESQWRDNFLKKQLFGPWAWLRNHNEAIDNKILVSISELHINKCYILV